MERLYDNLLLSHLHNLEEMAFISGPRQAGKTTTSKIAEALTDRFLYVTYSHHQAAKPLWWWEYVTNIRQKGS